MVCKGKPCDIIFNRQNRDLPHENTMDIYAYEGGVKSPKMRVMSVGGGDIKIEGRAESRLLDIYPESSFEAISQYCKEKNIRISEFVIEREGEEISPNEDDRAAQNARKKAPDHHHDPRIIRIFLIERGERAIADGGAKTEK